MNSIPHRFVPFIAAAALTMAPHSGHAEETMTVEMHSASTEGIKETIGTKNRALVLHSRRDSYSGETGPAGGSGDAIACGVAEGD